MVQHVRMTCVTLTLLKNYSFFIKKCEVMQVLLKRIYRNAWTSAEWSRDLKSIVRALVDSSFEIGEHRECKNMHARFFSGSLVPGLFTLLIRSLPQNVIYIMEDAFTPSKK